MYIKFCYIFTKTSVLANTHIYDYVIWPIRILMFIDSHKICYPGFKLRILKLLSLNLMTMLELKNSVQPPSDCVEGGGSLCASVNKISNAWYFYLRVLIILPLHFSTIKM